VKLEEPAVNKVHGVTAGNANKEKVDCASHTDPNLKE
jgi:hypothetical protein